MASRDASGRFVPGQSGNPSGRPANALREQMAEKGGDVATVVIERALKGDMTAAKLVIERLVPALKPQAAPVSIDLNDAQTLSAVAQALIDAAAHGDVPADQAAALVSAVGATARVVEVDEVRRRLDDLEAAQ